MKKAIIFFLFMICVSFIDAKPYPMTLTRLLFDLYEETKSGMLVVTKECNVNVDSTTAVLELSVFGSKLAINTPDGKKICEVADVYARTTLKKGKHRVNITRLAPGYYSLNGLELYIRAIGCDEEAYEKKAVLKWDGKKGKLHLPGRQYEVEYIYEKISI